MTDPKTNQPFPCRLKEIMNNVDDCSPLGRQVSQRELSQAIGLTRQAISNYMLGVTSPRIEEFQKIALFFGISLDYLSGKDDCTIREYEGIHEYTGLSEKTIKALHSYKIRPKNIIENNRENETARAILVIDLLFTNKDMHGNDPAVPPDNAKAARRAERRERL